MSEVFPCDESKVVPDSFVPKKRRAKICFGLGDTIYVGLLEGNTNQIMSDIDDLSTILVEDIGIYWF